MVEIWISLPDEQFPDSIFPYIFPALRAYHLQSTQRGCLQRVRPGLKVCNKLVLWNELPYMNGISDMPGLHRGFMNKRVSTVKTMKDLFEMP
jgi:hypothetical protein